MKGLAMLLGLGKKKSKPSDDEGDEEAPDSSEDMESNESDDLFGDAFDAIKDGDRKGFIRLMKEAVKDCAE
jgi:hypothetical protein